ncbi:MAG: segregation/condensation protein A [Nanoarchaeota archaeon]|nr:segregation/condensation protein A [Nanoarchaeota archaeon]
MVEEKKENEPKTQNAQQQQIQNLLFNREIGWQEIIYDLINAEQLDPWNIDIIVLTDKYLEKIRTIEEADFFVSSKVLLAASLLLKIKSEILLDKYIKSIDDILFGKEEKKKYELERIELDEEIPELIPKSPIPRFRKVTLKELIESLNKAISTENRRIKREVSNNNAMMENAFAIPKRKYNISDKIKEIYEKLTTHLKKNSESKKVSFTNFVGENKEERLISFFPLLHLETQKKVWLEQENHFDEIYIWLKETYLEHNADPLEELKKELEEQIAQFDKHQRKRADETEEEFENPVDEEFEVEVKEEENSEN